MSADPGPLIPPQAESLLRAGRKVAAIKQVLDANPGIDLRAAKQAVEAFAAREIAAAAAAAPPAQAEAGTGTGTETLPSAAVMALMRGDSAAALRILEEEHGLRGVEAMRRIVEHKRTRSRQAARPRPTVARGDGNGMVLAALLLALAAVAAWHFL
ncbi:hypothetical protein [Vulcaniibacterium tengchongense]|uniref:Ribosomal L7/L12-like protein n=1 Tax=Vulcaniibacterium tengchongense TaxID=1273429 RepID=A0A3N4VBU3_9GAMM|nr:hypothetical protein [Vulcaniibacterium tengchongense]RPE74597.1 hypothetical protein EDC50_3206 [Vulcaniibacterium tengchongense]